MEPAMEFAHLSNEEQIERLERLARTALTAWGVTHAQIELIKYRENAVFSVVPAEGHRGVLRVHRPRYRTHAHIRSEFAWIGALSGSGVLTPGVVRTTAGDVLTIAAADGVPEPRQCDLLPWVDGHPLGSLESGVALDDAAVRRSYRTIGEIAARIHAHARTWNKPGDFIRPAWDVNALVGKDPTFGRFWELEILADDQLRLLTKARDRARERLQAFGQSSDRYGLTHGDLVPDNVLVGTDGIRVVDFDDCGDSWYGFELATSLFPLFGSPAFEPARDGYLEGYRSVRALPEEHLALMPTFLMARGLSYLGWPAGRKEMQSGRDIASFLAMMVTDLAEQYLVDTL